MKLKFHIVAAFMLLALTGFSQSILFQENFESGGASFTLNGAGIGTNSGTNEWIVNNNYTGGGIYPNTINEDSTFGGTISYAPYGHYLHIYDATSGYTDCLYNPSNLSDRFAYTNGGTCTLGDTGVEVSFFYLCQGSPTAYGTVYYSKAYGPWTQCGLLKYNSKYKWQYATISDPSFNNTSNLRIGVRWQNNAGAGKDTSAFALDDFNIIGYPNVGSMQITATVSPDTICANSNATVYLTFTQSDSMCDGNYAITLYDSANNPVTGWIATSYSPTTNGPYALTIPNTVKGTHCYHWRVDRTTPPAVTGVFTACFYVENCPNTITTQQPVATMNSDTSVCAGSTIQVPFFSTGTYGNTSIYYAELSDSAGNFLQPDSLHNALFSNSAYPPTGSPGNVLVWIPDTVPAGCDYYLRVLSSSPHDTGFAWGPFCITHCDMNIQTPGGGGGGGGNAGNGSPTNLLACIHSCAMDPAGFNDTLDFAINTYASNVTYNPGNKFEAQILSTSSFSVVNTGSFGVDTSSGKFIVHVPCADSVCNLDGGLLLYPSAWGGYGGSFYLRIIATNSTPPDSNVSPIIFFNIGYPNDKLSLDPPSPRSDEYCLGEYATFYADPLNTCTWDWYNANTSYQWWLNNAPIFNAPFVTSVGFKEAEGTYTVLVQEDNNGCYGPIDTTVFFVNGPPSTSMTGPTKVCQGDTGLYTISFNNNTVYKWSAAKTQIIDTANNVLMTRFDSVGTFIVKVTATDSCGSSTGVKVVTVVAKPVPDITGPSSICVGEPVTLNATGGTSYAWTPSSGLSCTNCPNPTATPPSTTVYTVTVSNGTCSAKDSVKLVVNAPPTGTACCSETIILGDSVSIHAASGGNVTYSWAPSSGLSCTTCANPIANPTVTTTYTVTMTDTTDGCQVIDTVRITVNENCGQVFVPDAFSPNGDGQNDILYVRGSCIKTLEFSVYDRWGNKVFETTDKSIGWDGKYRGQPMNTGTYVYYLNAITDQTPEQTITRKGNVTLVR